MTRKSEQLAELDREFNSPENCATGAMKLDVYHARRKLIEAQPDTPKPAPAPAADLDQPRAVTWPFFKDFMSKLTDAIKECISGNLKPRDEKIAALEKRIAELEKKPSLKYRGVFSEQEQYGPADLCTHGGALWHCREITRDRPGSSAAWQMTTKQR